MQDLNARNIKVINLSTEICNSPPECLHNFLTKLNQRVVSYRKVPRFEHDKSEAETRVPKATINDFEKQSFRLDKCVEYLVYCPLTDEGQYDWRPPNWVPLEALGSVAPNSVRKRYQRTDSMGNIWVGVAIGVKAVEECYKGQVSG